MTLTLILIRHAKSDWGAPGLSDHDRPLNDRGRAAAPRIGAWLQQSGYLPDTVLCSTARRTRETWDGVSSRLDMAPAPTLTRGLYNADQQDILNAIRSADGASLAVIGHNPGIGSLAWALASAPPMHEKFGLYPTGATTILQFDATGWDRVELGTGKVIDFAIPRELPDPA